MVDPERLYRDHAPALMRYLVHLTGDRDSAADVLHETFIRLVERPPRDEGSRAWLFMVATNIVRHEGRTATRRREIMGRVARDPTQHPSVADPADLVVREERREAVAAALATLTTRDRTVLLMRAEGFTHEEIATVVATTTKSVGTITARALQKLAVALRSLRPDWE